MKRKKISISIINSLLTLKNDNLVKSLSALNPLDEVNVVIEGIIPQSEYGEICLSNEVTQHESTYVHDVKSTDCAPSRSKLYLLYGVSR